MIDLKGKEVLDRFMAGESDFEEYEEANGVRTKLVRDPGSAGGFKMINLRPDGTTLAEFVGIRFSATAIPPTGMPPDFPFLPGSESTFLREKLTGVRMIKWEGVPDSENARARIRAYLESTGWECVQTGGGEREVPLQELWSNGTNNRRLVFFVTQQKSTIVLSDD